MKLDKLLSQIAAGAGKEVLVSGGQSHTCADLSKKIAHYLAEFQRQGLSKGQVLALQADYSLNSIAMLLALWANGNIVALIPNQSDSSEILLSEAKVQWFLREKKETFHWEQRAEHADHPLLKDLQQLNKPGFVIFSSGSTGKPKAILHDVEHFLGKFQKSANPLRTLVFLLFDHIAGLDTLFYILCSGGVAVIPEGRETASVCALIEKQKVDVLPTSPTFLNLLCLSHQYEDYDLSSLKVITYGSEPMNAAILSRVEGLFPKLRIIQKYGLSEIGSPRTKSKKGDSLWIKIEDKQCQSKVVDNILWIKSKSTMLGYLNAPPCEQGDGWISTGDEVEIDGEWMKILGRASDLIIVGGEKVYPSEVESVLLQMPEIQDAVVCGEAHALMGNIVVAKVLPAQSFEKKALLKTIRKYCRTRLAAYKIPVKLELIDHLIMTDRQKKER